MSGQCPCGSDRLYSECCKIFHEGMLAPNAALLMRSRYSAYACNLPDYIIATTHPESPHFKQDRATWTKEIEEFCRNTEFQSLEMIEFVDGNEIAYVTFIAYLQQQEQDFQLKEKSLFEKLDGKWLYVKDVQPH